MEKYNRKSEDCLEREQKNSKLIQPTEEQLPSILNFSHENLSVSQSTMEQGFNKHSVICSHIIDKQTIFYMCTIILALSCIFLEILKLPKVMENSRDIEILKRDLEILKRQFYEENSLDELTNFEQQLYDSDIDDIWSGNDVDEDINELNDYDDNYDDGDHEDDDDDYVSNQFNFTNVKNNHSEILSTITPDVNKNLSPVVKNINESRSRENEKIDINKPENKTSIDTTQSTIILDNKKHLLSTNSTVKQSSMGSLNIRNKRSSADKLSIEIGPTKRAISHISHNNKHKYFRSPSELNANVTNSAVVKRKRRQHIDIENETRASLVPRVSGKRNPRIARQTFAAHYGADVSLFTDEDEHIGNGKLRHGAGIFKAWRPSDWMNNYGMDRHFLLNNDGRLIIQETGLYFVYIQIHYLDEHDENGFQLLVNDRSILQCMVYSPGTGHKSRSCFSAQVTLLHNNDRVVIKDVGVSRYTLFQKDKSFFGLIKIAEVKHPQVTSQSPIEFDE